MRKLFQGRVARGQFIMTAIFLSILGAAVREIYIAIPTETLLQGIVKIPLLFILVILVILSIANFVRRLHDMGLSGYWMLTALIPFGNILLFFYLYFRPGDTKKNKYGVKPSALFV